MACNPKFRTLMTFKEASFSRDAVLMRSSRSLDVNGLTSSYSRSCLYSVLASGRQELVWRVIRDDER